MVGGLEFDELRGVGGSLFPPAMAGEKNTARPQKRRAVCLTFRSGGGRLSEKVFRFRVFVLCQEEVREAVARVVYGALARAGGVRILVAQQYPPYSQGLAIESF